MTRAGRCAARLFVAVALCALAIPGVATAAPDPEHVQFKLEGCRIPAGETLPNGAGAFVCADADYTSGNLGKNWAELDLVPHRVTATTGTAQTYTIAIAADAIEAGTPGYDVISVPVVNAALSSGTCSVSAGPQTSHTPGVGGTDTSIARLLTITQSAGSTCVFDYYERLALGSAGFPGSSLHSNLVDQLIRPAGIGARDVPLPVNELRPQQLSKTMSATRGSATSWNIAKDATPTDLAFETCSSAASAKAKTVAITVRWTKTTVSANAVTLVSNITITNAARRPVVVTVTDKMYRGTTQANQVGTTFTSAPTTVAALSSVTVSNTQTTTPGPTHFNDVATATYTDPVTGVAIPGTTTAQADADVQTVSNAANDTATISDTEAITGAGLTFSVDSTLPAATGAFGGAYLLGSHTTGPVTWTHTVNGSGQVVFNKTVHVDGERNTTGTLSDVATLTEAAGAVRNASASTGIVARACIRGEKFDDTNVNGVRDVGEPALAGVTIYLDLNDNSVLDALEPSAVTDAAGSFVISTVGLADGIYKLREVLPIGQTCTTPVPCVHLVVVGPGAAVSGLRFGNHPLLAGPPTPPPGGGSGQVSGPPPPPPAVPVGPQDVPPTGKLYGPTRCVSRRFTAFVLGTRLYRVRFYVDGVLVATVTRANGPRGRFQTRIDSANFAAARTHRVVARIQFAPGSRATQRVQLFNFRRCGRAATPPRFTG